jgi:hypothetical protein
MLNLLALPLWMVAALLVTSQITNILFLQVGGRLADRYSNRWVLTTTGPIPPRVRGLVLHDDAGAPTSLQCRCSSRSMS